MNLKDTLERLEEMKEFQRGQAEICQEHGFPCSSFRYDPDALESAITLLKRYSEALEKIETLEVDQDDDMYLNWSCDPCGIDYSRRQFPVPKHILAQHRKAITDAAQEQRAEDERALLAD